MSDLSPRKKDFLSTAARSLNQAQVEALSEKLKQIPDRIEVVLRFQAPQDILAILDLYITFCNSHSKKPQFHEFGIFCKSLFVTGVTALTRAATAPNQEANEEKPSEATPATAG